MIWFLLLLAVAVVWLLCGAFNVAYCFATGDRLSISDKQTVMAFGPLLTVYLLLGLLVKVPFQLAARLGTSVGQKVYDHRMN
jgi:hypothetical protein